MNDKDKDKPIRPQDCYSGGYMRSNILGRRDETTGGVISISRQTLRYYRETQGLPYIALTKQLFMYPRDQVCQWLQDRRRQ